MTRGARSFPGRTHRYDVLLVGAGAAGSEAAWRLARAGADVLLTTTSLDTVYAAASERPRFDPPADSLGAAIEPQLARGRDGAVGAWDLHAAAKYELEAQSGLHLLQSNADALLVEDGRVTGVATWEGVPRRAAAVALCVGPFLRARLRIGDAVERAGRPGEMAYDDLADDLERQGLTLVEDRDAGGGGDAPAWGVLFERLADEETRGVAVPRLPGLYAAGICAAGPMPYASAVRQGAELAAALNG